MNPTMQYHTHNPAALRPDQPGRAPVAIVADQPRACGETNIPTQPPTPT
ncbi:MAG: hypothetical protein IT431_01160 [Phycisphaerales bacterium]|nr:hypothetical protein [Phycisphaerales bacterium]